MSRLAPIPLHQEQVVDGMSTKEQQVGAYVTQEIDRLQHTLAGGVNMVRTLGVFGVSVSETSFYTTPPPDEARRDIRDVHSPIFTEGPL